MLIVVLMSLQDDYVFCILMLVCCVFTIGLVICVFRNRCFVGSCCLFILGV